MRKRVLGVLLTAMLSITILVGCQEQSEKKEEVTITSDSKVAVFYYSETDDYVSSVKEEMDKQLDDLGVNYDTYDAENSQERQNTQIDEAIENGATALIINIVNAGSREDSTAILEKAKKAEIPVIFFNRSIEPVGEEGSILNSYDNCAYVGTNPEQAGQMQGDLIGRYIADNYDAVDLNGDGQISYAMFMGQEGNIEAINRTQYAVENANTLIEQAKGEGHELVYFDETSLETPYQVDPDGAWSADAAKKYMQDNLTQYNIDNDNMIELIICNNDAMAKGAIEALNEIGYNKGKEDANSNIIPVFGVDATEEAKQLIADGKMEGTIKQDAKKMADAIVAMLGNTSNGKEIMEGIENSYTLADGIDNEVYIEYSDYYAQKQK